MISIHVSICGGTSCSAKCHVWDITGFETGAPNAKVALLRWQNSKVKKRTCLRHTTERAVKRNRHMHYRKIRWRFIVKVGGDIKYENIQGGINKKFSNIELSADYSEKHAGYEMINVRYR